MEIIGRTFDNFMYGNPRLVYEYFEPWEIADEIGIPEEHTKNMSPRDILDEIVGSELYEIKKDQYASEIVSDPDELEEYIPYWASSYVDVKKAATDAIKIDGACHFVRPSDGKCYKTSSGYIYWKS